MESSDEELCRAVAERKPGAFDLLVERYQERAYRIAWSVVRDREEARDCSQEAFLRLHESAGSFAGQSKFSTWFYRILVNCCLDQQRRGRGWKRLLGWRDRREEFADEPVAKAFETHRRRAALVAELEDRVAKIIAALKERGLQSPYLRSFVVARINPLRWIKGDELPPAEKVLGTMLDRAAKFNLEKVKQQDLAGAYGAEPDE